MDDAGSVAVLQRVEDARNDLDGPLGREPGLFAEQFAQGPAFDILHHDERDPVAVEDVLSGVVNGDDVAVIQDAADCASRRNRAWKVASAE